jgi:hypothetical protein
MGKKGKAKQSAAGEQAAEHEPADSHKKSQGAKADIENIFSAPKKASVSAQPAAAAEHGEQQHKKKRAKNDIDEIFSVTKKCPTDPKAAEEGHKEATNSALELVAQQVKEGREQLQVRKQDCVQVVFYVLGNSWSFFERSGWEVTCTSTEDSMGL